jgi:hypothetical protein
MRDPHVRRHGSSTGASRSFGRIWAEAALRRGDKVAATVRQLADVAELTKLFGDAVLPLGLDVTDREQVRKVIGQALGSFRLCCPCYGNRAAGTSSASQVAWGLWRCRSSASIAPPNGQAKRSSIKRGLTWSRSTLLHQRGSALADLLELHFKTTKLLRA